MTAETTRKALEIARTHGVRSFDANLVATAETNEISVIISDVQHIAKLCIERSLILANAIPEEVRKKMRQ